MHDLSIGAWCISSEMYAVSLEMLWVAARGGALSGEPGGNRVSEKFAH
jgi:hypothetical protein